MAVKRYNGTSWDVVAGLGAQGQAATSSSIATWVKTASGGETSVSGNDDSSQPLSYTVGQELVFINGVLQKRGDDYTATTGNSITGLTALTAGDIVSVWTVNAFSVSNAISNTIVDAKGDILVGTGADTPGRLAVGTDGQFLTAASTTGTGLAWATPASGALTLLSTTTLSGTTNITSISGSYNNLVIYIQDPAATADFNMLLWCNQNTSTSQIHLSNGLYGTAAFNTNNYFYITGLEDINTYTGTAIAMRIENYAATNQTKVITSWGFYRNASNLFRSFRSNGIYNVSGTAITSLRFDTTGGTFNGGTVRIYGEK